MCEICDMKDDRKRSLFNFRLNMCNIKFELDGGNNNMYPRSLTKPGSAIDYIITLACFETIATVMEMSRSQFPSSFQTRVAIRLSILLL